MKSIEEKAKAYDEAIEKLRSLHDDYDTVSTLIDIKEELEHIFPELKESEDERIRIALIDRIECFNEKHMLFNNGVSKNKVIAWLEKQYKKDEEIILLKDKIESLESARIAMQECHRLELEKLEKQGEQKPVVEMKTPEESLGVDSDTYKKVVDECIYGEQKPTDKVEPKFKVGDFIVNDYCMGRIVEITNDAYLLDTEQGIPFSCHSTRLWDITKDANDGDVLADDRAILLFRSIGNRNWKNVISYYAILETNLNNRFSISDDEEYWGKVEDCELNPASKEQCDLLFQKMKEAGYVWDADRLKLTKCEKKTEWSEEDEIIWGMFIEMADSEPDENFYGATKERCSSWLKSIKDRVQPKQECSEEDERIVTELIGIFESAVDGGHVTFPYRLVKDYIRVLKLCLPQNSWKPSEEQLEALLKLEEMHVLEHEKNQENAHLYMVVKSLREQLNKLREE